MGRFYTKLDIVIAAVVLISATAATSSFQRVQTFQGGVFVGKTAAPIATSGDKNVYVAWPSNKTGNNEVMFEASTDGGKTFGDKMNLSNSRKSESVDVQIGAAGNNVYVTWWERNQKSNEPK